MKAYAKNKYFIIGCLVGALGLSAPIAVEASCLQSDLTGTWYATGVFGNTSGSFNGDLRCKLIVSSTGGITPTGSSCIIRDNSGKFTMSLGASALKVGSGCGLSGNIQVCGTQGCDNHKVDYGQIDKDKTILNANLFTTTDPTDIASLTAIKQ